MQKMFQKSILFLLFCGGGFMLFSAWMHLSFSEDIYQESNNCPKDYPVAIIFGAGVWGGNRPSPVLYDRLKKGAELYQLGIVKKLLLTGDNRKFDYNEPRIMKETLLRMGIPSSAMILDFAGIRTYDSCYRAKHIFCVEKAILVTQKFHLPRALYLAKSFGIEAIGMSADGQPYPLSSRIFWYLREGLAQMRSVLNIYLGPQKPPILGHKIPWDAT